MSHQSKREFLQTMIVRYRKASRAEKRTLLDSVCEVCGYHRKYAIRLLKPPSCKKEPCVLKPRGRKRSYDDPLIMRVLIEIWRAANLPCAKRLKAILALWLPFYDLELPQDVQQKLQDISAATIDRLLKSSRGKYRKRGLATTKPGSLLKHHIPVKTNQWDETVPGFLEADTVAHCGTSMAGAFVFTVNATDLATGWSEQRAVWGKGERDVLAAITSIEHTLPFKVRGFDCDNGSEFLNWHLERYLQKRKRPIQFTRSRPYHKNDNAHIENKNWTHVRQYLGYQRFDNPEITALLNELYTSEWRWFMNVFMPSVKLIEKKRVGSKIVKKYDQPQTPLVRVLASKHLSAEEKRKLKEQCQELNPFLLQKAMSQRIKRILALANNKIVSDEKITA
ncbi:integrase [candidate division KSB1 bacterium]|nr:integrase [candidate division KSB1 bacterium]